MTINETTVDAAAVMDAMPWGQNFHFSSRVDAGSWTGDDVLRRPVMGLITDGLDDGAGGSASILGHVGLHGGFAT